MPAQKWNTFYMKVLSKIALVKGLKIRVMFEAPNSDAQTRAKLDEARAALKELGLDDRIREGQQRDRVRRS